MAQTVRMTHQAQLNRLLLGTPEERNGLLDHLQEADQLQRRDDEERRLLHVWRLELDGAEDADGTD